jgi:hypothetical protein
MGNRPKFQQSADGMELLKAAKAPRVVGAAAMRTM